MYMHTQPLLKSPQAVTQVREKHLTHLAEQNVQYSLFVYILVCHQNNTMSFTEGSVKGETMEDFEKILEVLPVVNQTHIAQMTTQPIQQICTSVARESDSTLQSTLKEDGNAKPDQDPIDNPYREIHKKIDVCEKRLDDMNSRMEGQRDHLRKIKEDHKSLKASIDHIGVITARLGARINGLAELFTSQKLFAESSYRDTRRSRIHTSLHALGIKVAQTTADRPPSSLPTWLLSGFGDEDYGALPVDEILEDPIYGPPSENTRQPTANSTASEEKPFTLFPSFAAELRIKIWTQVLPCPRVLEIFAGEGRQFMMTDSFSMILNLSRACTESREIVLKIFQHIPATALGLRGLPPGSVVPFDLRRDLLHLNNVALTHLILRAEPAQLLSKLTTISFDLELFDFLLNDPKSLAIGPLLHGLGSMVRLSKIMLEVKGCDHLSTMAICQPSTVTFVEFAEIPPNRACETLLARFRKIALQDDNLKSLQGVKLVFVKSRRQKSRFSSRTRYVVSGKNDPFSLVVYRTDLRKLIRTGICHFRQLKALRARTTARANVLDTR